MSFGIQHVRCIDFCQCQNVRASQKHQLFFQFVFVERWDLFLFLAAGPQCALNVTWNWWLRVGIWFSLDFCLRWSEKWIKMLSRRSTGHFFWAWIMGNVIFGSKKNWKHTLPITNMVSESNRPSQKERSERLVLGSLKENEMVLGSLGAVLRVPVLNNLESYDASCAWENQWSEQIRTWSWQGKLQIIMPQTYVCMAWYGVVWYDMVWFGMI